MPGRREIVNLLNRNAFISYVICLLATVVTIMITIADPGVPGIIVRVALTLWVAGLLVHIVGTYFITYFHRYSVNRCAAFFLFGAELVCMLHPLGRYAIVNILLLLGSMLVFWLLNFTEVMRGPKKRHISMNDNT